MATAAAISGNLVETKEKKKDQRGKNQRSGGDVEDGPADAGGEKFMLVDGSPCSYCLGLLSWLTEVFFEDK